MTWKPDELSFDFRYELTFGQVVTVRIQTPAGAVFAMAEVEERGRTLVRTASICMRRPAAERSERRMFECSPSTLWR
jgi:hypothetical protein